METPVTRELRRIANDLDAAYSRIADTQFEEYMQEVKRKFFESFRKTHGLEHLNPEKLWNQMQDSIRREIRQRPQDWKA